MDDAWILRTCVSYDYVLKEVSVGHGSPINKLSKSLKTEIYSAIVLLRLRLHNFLLSLSLFLLDYDVISLRRQHNCETRQQRALNSKFSQKLLENIKSSLEITLFSVFILIFTFSHYSNKLSLCSFDFSLVFFI